MFIVDQKFPRFSLEAYLPASPAGRPHDEKIIRLTNNNFKNRWLILFFYPADFTFVCPTELADLLRRSEEFKMLKAEIVGVSTDTVFTHKAWLETEELIKGIKFPMAADHNGRLSRELGIYNEEKGLAQRAVFIIDPKGILRAVEITSDSIGRSAGEILRKVKALHFVETHPGNVCPASWDEGKPTLKPSIQKAGKVYKELR